MKISSFKKFLEEEDSKAIVQTGLNSKSIDNSVTKEIINSRLANATANEFLTPYIALGSVARILAYVNIVVPQYTFLDRDEGEVVFDATQVGQIAGVNLDGSPARSEADHFIYFSYSMNDDGYYDCFAALVDSDELERIMDMGGDEDVDQFDVDQKVNEELKGNQHKLDVAEPKGKLTAADFKKLRGEKSVDEVLDTPEGKSAYLKAASKSLAKAPMGSRKEANRSAGIARAKGLIPAKIQPSKKAEKVLQNEEPVDETNVNMSAGPRRGQTLRPHMQSRMAQVRRDTGEHIRGEEVNEEPINERKSSDPKGLAYKVTAASHAANPQWGPADHTQDPKTHFGTAATRSSTLAAVRSIRAQRSQGGFDANNPKHVDAAAKAVHGSPQDYEGKPRGWSQTAMTHSGQSPEQKERRAKLTGPYDSLSEPEKEKDREIVRTIAANMPTKKK